MTGLSDGEKSTGCLVGNAPGELERHDTAGIWHAGQSSGSPDLEQPSAMPARAGKGANPPRRRQLVTVG